LVNYYIRNNEYQTAYPEIFKISDMQGLGSAGRFYMEKGDYKKAIELSQKVLNRKKEKESEEKTIKKNFCCTIINRAKYC
jgi:tetratricopeptide (TPR) repeat protein